MRKLLAFLALGLSLQSAQAAFVEFSLEGEVGALGTGSFSDIALGSTFSTTYVLDTSAFGSAGLNYRSISSPTWSPISPVIDTFLIQGATFASVRTSLGGHLFSASSAGGTFDGLLSSASNGDDYDMSMLVQASDFSMSLRDFNTSHRGGFTADYLGTDPLTSLALSFDGAPAFTYLRGDFGWYGITMRSVTVREVPEPASAMLFLAALACGGIGLRRCGRVRASRA